MAIRPKLAWFLAFTAIFAALAGFVFWGTWATNVTFVAPDDGIFFARSYSDVVRQWWNGFVTTGKMLPTDVLWSGLLGSPLFCRELKYVAAIYLAALGLVYFLRGRGLSRLAAYGAALLLAFCGYWLTLFSAGHGGWFIWMSYGVFAFGLIDRAVEKRSLRHWVLLGLVVAWASFHQPDLWLLFSVFTGFYLVFRLVVGRVLPWKGILCAAAVFTLVGLPSFYHAFVNDLAGRDRQVEESRNSALTGGVADDDAARWIFATNWSMPLEDAGEFWRARLHGDTSCPLTLSINRAKKGTRPYTGALGRPFGKSEGNYRQHSLYVGWVTCLMALAGIALGYRRKTVVFFAVGAAVFFLFSLGRNCEVVYRLVYQLPFGDYLRAPVKWHHLTEFCLCVLAGYGLEALVLRSHARLAGGGLRLALGALVVLVLIGAGSLASNARLYCAPVDYTKAVRSKCSAQLTVLSRPQLEHPQVAEMIRAGRIVIVARWLGSPDASLVQILEPLKPVAPAKPNPLLLTFGVFSVVTAVGAGFSCGLFRRKRLSSGPVA
ncbi:MAG: hypothetical protein ACI4R9_06550 [Kiritimatiellia bacterium]